jgi:hypothetical protein
MRGSFQVLGILLIYDMDMIYFYGWHLEEGLD